MTVPEAAGPIAGLVAEYAFAREALDEVKQRTKPFQERKDAAETALFDALENAGLKSVRHATLGLFTLSDLAEPRVADPATFVAWAERAMPEVLTANRQRLAVVIREILRGDRPFASQDTEYGLPPGVDFSTRRNINWRKG